MPDLIQRNVYTTGTYQHAVGTTEDDVKEYIGLRNGVEITFDVSALLQTTTIRVYEKPDGTTYRLLSNVEYPTDFDTNANAVQVKLLGKGADQKITFQSTIAEAGIIDVEWTQVETR